MAKRTKLNYIIAASFSLAFMLAIAGGAIRIGAAEEKLKNHSESILELKEQTKGINDLSGKIQRIDERTLRTMRLLEVQDENMRLLFRSLTNRDLPERRNE